MRRLPRVRISIALIAVLLSGSLIAAAAVEAQDVFAPPSPPPGRLVDVGGWRLHLHCTGEVRDSQATVILEAGLGDFSVEWSLVQPRVVAFARVCSYDRAGSGWSDLGPLPRTMRQIAFELHTLLDKAGVRPPYVLVGQSYGGVLVRVYAATYPQDVAGMVLVDGGRLNPLRFINGQLVSLPDIARGRPVPPVQTSNPLRESDIPPDAKAQIEAAARRMASRANEPPRDKLPLDAQRMRTWGLAQIKHYAGYGPGAAELEAEELALMIADQQKEAHPLGDRPLIVLTAGNREYDQQALEDDRQRMQAALAKISRNGKQVIAVGSGHHIHIEDPALVVKAIREVLLALRR